MMYSLSKLPYDYDALEPAIDAQTMEIHHGKHHQGYVDKLNATGVKEDLESLLKNLNSLPGDIKTAVRNNAGGHYNHSLFWALMAKDGGEPSADLKSALEKSFGGVDQFKTAFSDAAMTRFGSGWAWLVVNGGKLSVGSTPNQDNPLMTGVSKLYGKPILALDIWEHAYYLKYQNRRPDYIKAWWNVVNWKEVNKRFAAVIK
ncbi:MAG: superoxide dismutase [Candidatus Beckwithbacteria bacterium]|nr:superoxide dismutase [Candidatus Beckwithbacteria bacterium]